MRGVVEFYYEKWRNCSLVAQHKIHMLGLNLIHTTLPLSRWCVECQKINKPHFRAFFCPRIGKLMSSSSVGLGGPKAAVKIHCAVVEGRAQRLPLLFLGNARQILFTPGQEPVCLL